MGTAGPLALARDILWNDSNTPFFVLNRRAHAGGSGSSSLWAAACGLLLRVASEARRGSGGSGRPCRLPRAATLCASTP